MPKIPDYVGRLDGDLLNSDWLASARLRRKAAKGNVAARKELRRRENTKMVPITKEEEEDIRRRLYGDS